MKFFSYIVCATCAWLAVSVRTLDMDMPAREVFSESEKSMVKFFGTCVEPDDPDFFATPAQLQAFMDTVNLHNVSETQGLADGWSNWAFAEKWVGRNLLPSHMIIGLYHDSGKYQAQTPVTEKDSECFRFDYNNPSAPDPAGCRPFAKTFRLLADLRRRLIPIVEADMIWNRRYERKLRTNEKAAPEEGFEYDQWCNQAVWTKDKKAGLDVQLCETNYDTPRRVEEMMKLVLFPPAYKKIRDKLGRSPSAEELSQHVKAKAVMSVNWPKPDTWRAEEKDMEFRQGLQEATVVEVAKVFGAHPDTFDLASFEKLVRISFCQTLMLDKTEISGYGFSDAQVKFLTPKYFDNGLAQGNVYPVSAFCGRMAFSLATPMQFAQYDMFPTTSSTITLNTRVPWVDCQNSKVKVNCRSAYYCYEAALRRACGLTPKCCPRGDEAVHNLCHDYPDGFLPTESMPRPAVMIPATLVNGGCSNAMLTNRWRSTEEAAAFSASGLEHQPGSSMEIDVPMAGRADNQASAVATKIEPQQERADSKEATAANQSPREGRTSSKSAK